MTDTNRIKELTEQLQKASVAYYKYDNPIMTDKQYDDLYDELEELESKTGVVLAGSPTQKAQGYILDGLQKVQHTKPMLSANKTKDVQQVKKFIGKNKCVVSWKEDGLTIVARYKNGEFVQGITRGTGGTVGEDVTHTMRMCKNLPLKIPFTGDLEVRGECLISWAEFDRLNKEQKSFVFKHPRNVAAGTVRQLDSNVAAQRNLMYKVFELIQTDTEYPMNIMESFDFLASCGFDVVEHELVDANTIESVIERFDTENYEYPVDGLIFTYNDYKYGVELGQTSHHPLNMLALKWRDNLYETKLAGVEWRTSKTGLMNPVAIFDPLDLDGAFTTRATLHNVSYIEDLQLGIGDTIQVYRSNMVIPKVHANLTRSNTLTLPDVCLCCLGEVEIRNNNGVKTLHCLNAKCPAKLISRLTHAVSKNALNIDGLSEATITSFVDLKWISSIKDIYALSDYKTAISELIGFGKKSAENLINAIEHSRCTTLERFIYALSIPLIGQSASKTISKYFKGDYEKFINSVDDMNWTVLEDFGDAANNELKRFFRDNKLEVIELAKEFIFDTPTTSNSSNVLENKVFVITGSVSHYANRDAVKADIESHGGKVVGSVSAKTSYLINNDAESNSSKNKRAKELGVPIISETEFMQLLQTK